MLRSLQFLLLVSCVTNTAGKLCVPASGQKTCTPGAGDCPAGTVCMEIENGKSNTFRTICGEPQAKGCICDKNLVSSEACQENLSCQEKNGKHKCQDSNIIQTNCNSSWELIYHNGRFGESESGTVITDFVYALKGGAEIKVWTAVFGLMNVQKASIAFDEDNNIQRVHGQSLFWVKPSPIRPFNLFFVFSTSGNVHMTQFFIGNATNDVRVNSNFPTEMKWFVRKMSAKVESDEQLFTAVKDGANIRVESDHEVRHLEIASVAMDTVQGVSIWEMRDELRGLQFNTTEQWLHKHWSLDGAVQKACWLVNTHQLNESESLGNVEITWYVDTCWKLVYRHNGQGQTLSGSWSRLHNATKEAKRVKVRIGTEFFEANSLHVTNDEIILHVYDSIDFNVTNGFWKWHVVSTSGLVKTYTVGLGNDTNVISSMSNETVSWLVEDREWTSVASDNRNAALQAAMDAGSDVRYRVQLGGESVWYQADVLSRELGAYNERELVVNGDQYLRRYTFAYWQTNEITQIDFPVGETGPFSYNERSVNIDWFTG